MVKKVDVKKISDNVKLQEWANRIKECRDSGKSVRQWCKNNHYSEQTYYYYLKKIRKLTVEQIANQQSFVPVPTEPIISSKKEMIIISKGDIHIEVPDNIEETILLGMGFSSTSKISCCSILNNHSSIINKSHLSYCLISFLYVPCILDNSNSANKSGNRTYFTRYPLLHASTPYALEMQDFPLPVAPIIKMFSCFLI